MAAINLHYPRMKVFQLSSTQVASGAKIYTYEAGTSTDKASYSDQALTTPNTNPVIADSNGEAVVWLNDDGLYKIVITDSADVAISTDDNQGTVAALTTAEGAYNLVPNGSFETNTGNNGTPTGWALAITGASTIQIDTASTIHGDSALEFVGGASGAGTATSGFFEVQASKEIGIRFSLIASAATVNQTVTMLWYTAAQAAASTASTTIYNVTTTAPTSWAEQILTATPGSDVKFAKVEISGSADAGTTSYDDVIVSYSSPIATEAEAFLGTDTFKALTPAVMTGRQVQVVNVQDGAVATGTTVMPDDNSIPQITEGDEYMTLSITPKSATNKLKIDVVFFGASTAAISLTAALFQDSTTGALAATSRWDSNANAYATINFSYYMTTGTTSATTFRVRAGSDTSNTTTFNGVSSGRLFGGVAASSITITEIQV